MSGTNLYSASGVINNDTDQFGIKIDHYLTQHDNLNFRYSFTQLSELDPLSPQGASVPGFPVGEDQRAQNFVAQETHTFTPTLVGVLRFSFLRNKFLYGQSEVHTSPESLGFQYSPEPAGCGRTAVHPDQRLYKHRQPDHWPAQYVREPVRLLGIDELGTRQA